MRVVTELDIFDKRVSTILEFQDNTFENLDGVGDIKKSQLNFNIRSEDGSVADHGDERVTNLSSSSSDTNTKSLGGLRFVQKITDKGLNGGARSGGACLLILDEIEKSRKGIMHKGERMKCTQHQRRDQREHQQ